MLEQDGGRPAATNGGDDVHARGITGAAADAQVLGGAAVGMLPHVRREDGGARCSPVEGRSTGGRGLVEGPWCGAAAGVGLLVGDPSLLCEALASRRDVPLSSFDADDINVLAGTLSSNHMARVIEGVLSAALAPIQSIQKPGAAGKDPTSLKKLHEQITGTSLEAPDATVRRKVAMDVGGEPKDGRGGDKVSAQVLGSPTRRAKDFYSVPVTEFHSAPELGLHGLIRSNSASFRQFGAHVFRIVARERRPVFSRLPKRHFGDKLRVRVQTFPQFPTIMCDSFSGRRAPELSVKRKELRAQLPSGREKRMSGAELRAKVGESANALQNAYGDFGVTRFRASVNDPSATWERRVTAAGKERAVMGGALDPVDVYYLSDMSLDNKDGCSRSLGDAACTAHADACPPRQRLANPRTLNHHTMLGAASTYEGANTSLLYVV